MRKRDDGFDEVEVVEDGSLALSAQIASDPLISQQVATARRFPRSVTSALQEAMTLATLDEDTAASMFYSIPRGGKTIEGPSARLAEVMAYTWGNLRAAAEVIEEGKTHVTAAGVCYDLEKNVAFSIRVKRRITDSKGKRYNDDMIGVTGNAATSIALRNAVFKVIPAAMVRRVYEASRQASIGKGGTITQKRQAVLEWFGKLGKTPEDVFRVIGVAGIDDIGETELIRLRGLATAIKDGEIDVETVFGIDTGTGESRASDIDERLKAAAAAKKEAKAAARKPEPEPEPEQAPEQEQDPEPEPAAKKEEKPKKKTRLDAIRERFDALVAEDNVNPDALAQFWHEGGLVSSADRSQWTAQDYRSAIAELSVKSEPSADGDE